MPNPSPTPAENAADGGLDREARAELHALRDQVKALQADEKLSDVLLEAACAAFESRGVQVLKGQFETAMREVVAKETKERQEKLCDSIDRATDEFFRHIKGERTPLEEVDQAFIWNIISGLFNDEFWNKLLKQGERVKELEAERASNVALEGLPGGYALMGRINNLETQLHTARELCLEKIAEAQAQLSSNYLGVGEETKATQMFNASVILSELERKLRAFTTPQTEQKEEGAG